MNLKRLFRLAAFSGLVAAAVAAVRSLTRDKDPLPSPAGGSSDPWPPLRSAAPTTLATVPDTVVDDVDDTVAIAVDDTVAESVDAPAVDEDTDSDGAGDDRDEEEADGETAESDTLATTTARRRRREPLRAPWMPPNDDGSCPDGYPLKANDQSMIFHAPGQMSYDRTVPERCYAEADAAVADGYRAAKR